MSGTAYAPRMDGGTSTEERLPAPLPMTVPAWRRTAAVVLLVGWALFVGLHIWTLPRESSEAQLRADIAAGRVVGYLQVYGLGEMEDVWGLRRVGFNTSDQGSGLAWDLGDGRTRYATITGSPVMVGSPPPPTINDDGTASSPVVLQPTSDLISDMRAHGARAGLRSWELVPVLGVVVGVLGLVGLLFGPRPERGTKWFWFWVLGISGGLGLVAWLLAEHVWPPRVPRAVRRRGILGFVIALASSLALSVLSLGTI